MHTATWHKDVFNFTAASIKAASVEHNIKWFSSYSVSILMLIQETDDIRDVKIRYG